MLNLLSNNVFETIVNFLLNTIGNYIGLDYLLYIILGIFVLMLVIIYIKSSHSYEVKAAKAIDHINTYLIANPYINEDNLVHFNKKMKNVPKTIRYQWQQYVLNRDKAPSTYLSRDNCVEKPLKTSTYHASIKLLKNISVILATIALVFGLLVNLSVDYSSNTVSYTLMVLFRASILPAIILVVSELFAIFLNARANALISNLYQIFYDFERNMDKAVTALPDYIDYEILFTKQEIKSGIPILQEYLDKRDRQQQEELKRAMAREIEHEKYDFDSTGIDGSLLLERAMKESELFIVNRKRLIAEVEQLQTEQENNKKNFDMATKEVNRKLQATKENLIKFKTQQEQSTNRIETNYIRKQQAEEVRKQQQLERDLEEAIKKFDEAQASIGREIQSRNDEIEENRKNIEEAMKAEFETFSEKAYKTIYDAVENKLSEQIQSIKDNTKDQELKIEELQTQLEDKSKISAELESKKEELEQLQKVYQQNEKLYNELLVKFNAINGEEVKPSIKNQENKQLTDAKNEILNAIKALTIVAPKNDGESVEKEIKPAKKTTKKTTSTKRIATTKKDSSSETVEAKKSASTTAKRKATKSTEDLTEEARKKAERDAEIKKQRAEARKRKREEEARQKANELLEFQKRIEEVNAQRNKQQDELKKVIDSTIAIIETKEASKPAQKAVVKRPTAKKTRAQRVQAKEIIKEELKEPTEVQTNQEVENSDTINSIQDLIDKMNSDNK